MTEYHNHWLKIPNKIYIGWNEIEDLIDNMCHEIAKNFPDTRYVYGLERGGLIPAVMVSHTLGLKYISDITEINLLKDEAIIVDDICDSGKTLKEFQGYNTAVLHYKPHTSSFTPNLYSNKHEGDEWIIYPWERDDSESIQDYLK